VLAVAFGFIEMGLLRSQGCLKGKVVVAQRGLGNALVFQAALNQ
jgi:hypothetical protein